MIACKICGKPLNPKRADEHVCDDLVSDTKAA